MPKKDYSGVLVALALLVGIVAIACVSATDRATSHGLDMVVHFFVGMALAGVAVSVVTLR
jgi:hypothetical protein